MRAQRTFVGIITKVAYSQEKMSLGNVILKGFSPTILMDSAPHTQSFGGTQAVNTSIIAERIIKETISSENLIIKLILKIKAISTTAYNTKKRITIISRE